MPLLIIVINT